MDCLLIADDLTGACDAAVHFAVRGLRSVVEVARGGGAGGARVVAISTESRDLAPAEAAGALLAVAHPAGGAAHMFKKIDSTLRGNSGLEVAVARAALGCEAAVVCPAFPKLHRVVEGGYLRVTSAPAFAPIDVAGLVRMQSGEACGHTRPEGIGAMLAGGARLVSVDANCEEDLDRIAAVLLPMGQRVLWAGSAGLASALARRLGGERASRPAPVRGGAVMFCIGSDHAVTLAQLEALVSDRGAVSRSHVIQRIPRGAVTKEQVREWMTRAAAAALVLSGGDTASLVCAAAGVQSIELYDEIVAGIPWGILRGGGFDGIPVATKSGGFGERDALIRVADFFHA